MCRLCHNLLIEPLVVTRRGEEEGQRGISVRGLSPMRGEGGIVLHCKFERNLGNYLEIIQGDDTRPTSKAIDHLKGLDLSFMSPIDNSNSLSTIVSSMNVIAICV